MSAKFKRQPVQHSTVKPKKLNYCVPCGNSYESEKKFYDHCCGLLHQVRRKENEKDFKPCCFLCKKTYPNLDAYGEHLNKDQHKEASRKFKQSMDNGKTVEQLVHSNVILSPIPRKPLLEGLPKNIPKKPVEQAYRAQPSQNTKQLPDTNFYQNPDPNYGWNFNQSQPPINYGGYPRQRFPSAQYSFSQYCQPNAYNWYNHQGNGNFINFHPNGNRQFRPQHCHQNEYARPHNYHQSEYAIPQNYHQHAHVHQYENSSLSFPAWRNNQYYTQHGDKHFNDKHADNFKTNQAFNVETSQGKRQHIYYTDNGKETEKSKIATKDTKQASAVEEKATKQNKTSVIDNEIAAEGDKRNVTCRKSNSPRGFDNQKRSSRWDFPSQPPTEVPQPAIRKLTPQDFTFALTESQKVDDLNSENFATPLRVTKSPFDGDRKTPQTPPMHTDAPNDGCLQPSPKNLGSIGSSKVQQQMNPGNLRNLVNLSCSRKDKFLLEKLMYEYDQMTIKSAMNRMGQNLVTLVDKDAAKDVIASLSAFGLLETGDSEGERPSNLLSKKLRGQIEELIQRSYHNGHTTDDYSNASLFQNCPPNQNAEFCASMKANNEFESSQNGQDLFQSNYSPVTFQNQEYSAAIVPFPEYPIYSSTKATQNHPNKNKKQNKKIAVKKAMPLTSKVKKTCRTAAQKLKVINDALSSLAPSKKKQSINSSKRKPDKNLLEKTPKNSSKNDVNAKKSKAPKSKSTEASVSVKTKTSKTKAVETKIKNTIAVKTNTDKMNAVKTDSNKTNAAKTKTNIMKAVKNPKKKMTHLEQPLKLSSDSSSKEAVVEEPIACTSLGPENAPSEVTPDYASPDYAWPCIDTINFKHEAEDSSMNDELPDVIEEPYIKKEIIPKDVIDLEASETTAPPQPISVAGVFDKAAPTPSLESDDSSGVTIRALNFAIEEEKIQCEILHIDQRQSEMRVAFERQQEEMKAAFERQLADMKAAFELEYEEATLEQDKLKERQTFVRQQWDSLMKNLLKSQDGRVIANSLKRMFSEIPTELKTPEAENPLPNENGQNAAVLMQTENETQANITEESCKISEPSKQNGNKRKRLDNCENDSNQTPPKKTKTNKNPVKETSEKDELITNIKKEESASVLSQMFPNCNQVEEAKLKKITNFSGHVNEVVILKMHKTHLYSCSNDGTIRRFKTKGKDDRAEMKCITTFTHMCDKIVAMEIFHEKDKETFIFTASKFGTLKKFDIATGNCLITVELRNEVVYLVSRWGSMFICYFDGNIARHSLVHLRELDSFPCSSLPITCVASATEGAYRILCIGSGDGLITLKEAHSGLFIRSYSLEEEHPFKIQVLKENSFTLGCFKQQCRSIYVHKLLNGDLLQKIDIVASVMCMQVVSENMIILGGKFGVIRLCNPKKNTMQLYYGAGNKTVSSLSLHRNLLISGNEDGKIEACNLALTQTFVCNYGRCPGKFAYHEDIVNHVIKIHAGSSQPQCLVKNCDFIFQMDQSDRVRHILTHVQLNLDKHL